MAKITRSVFVTVVFRYVIVGYVVYARYWPSPLRMVQSLQASLALKKQFEPMLGRSRTSRTFTPHGGVHAQPPHHLALLKAGRLGPTLTFSADDTCHPGGTFPWSLHGIVAFSLTLGKRKGLGPPSASREGSPRQCRAVSTSNWFAVMRPLGPHRTRTPPRTFEPRSSVIVLFCTYLAGSGKGVAGLPFGFLKGRFGAITGDVALLARLTRSFAVRLAQNAP